MSETLEQPRTLSAHLADDKIESPDIDNLTLSSLTQSNGATVHLHPHESGSFDVIEVDDDPNSPGFQVTVVTHLPCAEPLTSAVVRSGGGDADNVDDWRDVDAATRAWLRENRDGVTAWLREQCDVAAVMSEDASTLRCTTRFRAEPAATVRDVLTRASGPEVGGPHRTLRAGGLTTAMLDAVNAAAALGRP